MTGWNERNGASRRREEVLRRLQDLIDKGGDSDAIYRVMRERAAS